MTSLNGLRRDLVTDKDLNDLEGKKPSLYSQTGSPGHSQLYQLAPA